MKQIIIFLLLVIIGIMGYNVYTKYKRFSLTEYQYQIPTNLDTSTADKETLMDYHEAIEGLNGYVITQWSANNIDVRNPSNDDVMTLTAVAEYGKKKAEVAYFESMIKNPKAPKPEKKELTDNELKNHLIKKTFYANPSGNSLRLGEKNAMVFEIQRLLISHGDSIRHDGLFSTETFNALRAFEEKNGLLPDGKLDAITLEYLLK